MQKEFPVLKSAHLLLRQFRGGDLEEVFKGLSDPEVIRFYGVNYKTLEDTKEQLHWFAELEENETGIWWAICDLEDKVFYGATGFNNWDKANNMAEIGFWLLKNFWGKGIMKPAVEIVCDYAFKVMDLARVEAFVEAGNGNSKSLLNKLNFNYEDTLIDGELKDGVSISLDRYGLLAT